MNRRNDGKHEQSKKQNYKANFAVQHVQQERTFLQD